MPAKALAACRANPALRKREETSVYNAAAGEVITIVEQEKAKWQQGMAMHATARAALTGAAIVAA